jgi:hypothetical protein
MESMTTMNKTSKFFPGIPRQISRLSESKPSPIRNPEFLEMRVTAGRRLESHQNQDESCESRILDTTVLLLRTLQILHFLGHSGVSSELRDKIPARVYGTPLVHSVIFNMIEPIYHSLYSH